MLWPRAAGRKSRAEEQQQLQQQQQQQQQQREEDGRQREKKERELQAAKVLSAVKIRHRKKETKHGNNKHKT